MSGRNGKEYNDARMIGAYLMQSIIIDEGPNARQAANFMAAYSEICAKAFGINAPQIAVDIADTYKKLYGGYKDFTHG